MKNTFISLLLIVETCVVQGQQRTTDLERIASSRTPMALEEMKSLVAIPNDASNLVDIQENAEWLKRAFEKRAFEVQIIPTNNTPLVFAERKTPGARSTVLFYIHYDGQPVDAARWDQKSPYEVVLKEKTSTDSWNEIPWSSINGKINPEWRIFGRSVSDDKGPIIMFLSAMDALKEEHLRVPYNIKVILDGEEEKGSDQLPGALTDNKDLFRADHLLILDGPVHLSGKPTLVYGVRGAMVINLTVYGPKVPLHSGHYGNYAPNPVFRMARLLASMKDEDGRMLIPGYYDGVVLDEQTRNTLAEVPDDNRMMEQTFGMAAPEKVGANLQEALQYPTFNVRGLAAGHIGKEAANVIPTHVTASIDIRFVPETPPERLFTLIQTHIENQGYYVTDRDPLPEEYVKYQKICKLEKKDATLPFRTAFESPTGRWIERAFQHGSMEAPVKIRTMGATLPIIHFINILQIPTVIVPLVNADNNQHGENENLRIGNLTSGIKTLLAILTAEL